MTSTPTKNEKVCMMFFNIIFLLLNLHAFPYFQIVEWANTKQPSMVQNRSKRLTSTASDESDKVEKVSMVLYLHCFL